MSSALYNRPVLSLRTGTQIAIASEPIINPHNLKVLGWWCGGDKVLLAEDVREIVDKGLIINDEEDISATSDLVRHKKILDIKFNLLEKLVKTNRHKLGKVNDYSYNDGLFVQKLYVARSLIKVFSNDDTLIVDRTQILEVTDHYILVRDSEVDVKATGEELAGAVAT
jgi:uncharacterized protein YrrD